MSARPARILPLLLLAALAGCRGDRSNEPPRQFFPGMDDQPKYKTQSQSQFFPDGRTVRPPVAGTVPFGRTAQADDFRRPDFLRADDALYRGVGPDGQWLEYMPVEQLLADGRSMRDFIELGRQKFQIFCLPCHGGAGLGDGMVGVRWFAQPPSWHDAQYRRAGEKGQDGYIFNTIRNGVANTGDALPALRMPAYASQVSEREAWAIVAYIRTLQRARYSTIDEVPAAQRGELERTIGPMPTTPPAGQENSP